MHDAIPPERTDRHPVHAQVLEQEPKAREPLVVHVRVIEQEPKAPIHARASRESL